MVPGRIFYGLTATAALLALLWCMLGKVTSEIHHPYRSERVRTVVNWDCCLSRHPVNEIYVIFTNIILPI